jgi:glycosyltransferase involved in cell wall biosynthesis
VDGLAAAIAQLIDHPDQARQIAQAGRLKVLANYHLTRNVEALAAVFERRL